MKKAKDWFEEELSGEPLTQENVTECIKMVQGEMIDAIIKESKNIGFSDNTINILIYNILV